MVIRGNLLDRDPDELERSLLQYGRLDRAPDAARRSTMLSVAGAAVGATALTVTAISSAAGATPGTVPWLLVTQWMAVGLASGVVTLGVAGGLAHQSTSRLPEPTTIAAAPASAVTFRVAPTPALSADSTAEVTDDPTGDPAEGLARPMTAPGRANEASKAAVELPPRAPAPGAASSTALPPDGSLEGELRFLQDARLALDDHAAPGALATLDRYAEKFPAGRMGIEATALRVEALLTLGRRAQAANLARTFLAANPRSPAAMRVRRLAGDESKGNSNAIP